MTFKRGKGALEAKSQDTPASDGVQVWQMNLDTLNKNTSVFNVAFNFYGWCEVTSGLAFPKSWPK